MKKKLFLLPIALLLVGGCSAAEDGSNSGSGSISLPPLPASVEEAITLLKNTTEYKVRYKLEMSAQSSFDYLGPNIPCEFTRVVNGLCRVKGRSSSQNSDEGSMKLDYTMKISDMVERTGMSLEQLLTILEEYTDYFESYELDEANNSFSFRMDRSDDYAEAHSTTYTDLKEGDNQYCYAVFYNGHMTNSGYLPLGASGLNETMAMVNPIIEELEKGSSKLVEKDGKYVLDLSDHPVDIGGGEMLSGIEFGYTATGFTIGFTEQPKTIYVENVKGTYEIYDLNHSELDMPQFEVFCPFNHACLRNAYYNENQHIQECRYCNKFIGQPHNHNFDAKHHKCTECEQSGAPFGCEGFSLKTNGGITYLMGESYEDRYYNVHISNNGCDYNDSILFSDVEHYSPVIFYREEGILLLQYDTGIVTPFTTCYTERQEATYVFKDVNIELTPEQEAIIKAGTQYEMIREIYHDALDLPNSLSGIKAKYPNYDYYLSYEFPSGHNGESNAIHDGCYDGSYSVCAVCGECEYAQGAFRHEFDLTVVETPSWMHSKGYVCAQLGTCAKCGEHRHDIVKLNDSVYHEDYGYVVVCDNEGHEHEYFSNLNYHVDRDNDLRCDLCGAINLTVVSQGVPYTIYVYGQSVVSGSVLWTPMGGHDPIDGDPAVSYQYRINDLIYCNVAFHVDEDEHTISYRMFVGDDVYQSPAYPYGL